MNSGNRVRLVRSVDTFAVTRSVVLIATLSLVLPHGRATQLVVENLDVHSEGSIKRVSTPERTSQSPTPTAGSGNFAGLIDIGAGRKMYLECSGSGSPTVILESGYRNDADIWSTELEPGMSRQSEIRLLGRLRFDSPFVHIKNKRRAP